MGVTLIALAHVGGGITWPASLRDGWSELVNSPPPFYTGFPVTSLIMATVAECEDLVIQSREPFQELFCMGPKRSST